MISIVCWLWSDATTPEREEFKPEHVNQLQRMFARHYKEPHRFICVADKQRGLSNDVEWFETPTDALEVGALRSPEGPRFPSCYRRLWSFSDAARVLGDRILVIDIDLVVVKDPSRMLSPDEDFVGWKPYRDWGNQARFGGGIYLLKTGTRSFVWDDFKGGVSIQEARRHGYRGSDQAWISHKLAGANRREVFWSKNAGIYSVRDLHPQTFKLPDDAVLVQFNGRQKPWQSNVGWVMEHWNTGKRPPGVYGTSGAI